MAITNLYTTRYSGFGTDRDADEDLSTSSSLTSSDSFWIQLDVFTQETHNHATEITTNPVQNGAEVATNAVNMPIELTIVGGITDSPFTTSRGNFDGASGLTTYTNLLSSSNTSGTRSQNAAAVLVELKNSQTLITVDTGTLSYDNMLITNVTWETNAQNFNAPLFTISFKEILTPDDASEDLSKGTVSVTESSTDYDTLATVVASIATGTL